LNFWQRRKARNANAMYPATFVLVEDVCGCSDCDIVCCGAPMKIVAQEKTKTSFKPGPAKPRK
jgi:hypothetical protein